MDILEIFESYIVGDFSNIKQVKNETLEGQQRHPYARHINRKINHLIKNCPQNMNGLYLLEESIYQKEEVTTLKPHIFYFDINQQGKVVLHSYKLPRNFALGEIVNSNKNLWFDYNQLELSLFNPMQYEFNERKGFWGESISILAEDMVFRLEEIICKDYLSVMEEMKVSGNIITEYDTPIIYERENIYD